MTEIITKYYNKISGFTYYINENRRYHNINDKPSIVYPDGRKDWFKNGKKHRTKGPADIRSNGNEFWWHEGNHITEKVNQLMEEGRISSDWENWTEEDEFLFVLLVS